MEEQEVPQGLMTWLDEIREKGVALPSETPSTPYFIQGYKADGTSKQFRCIGAYQAEDDAVRLWNTGNWVRIEINGTMRYIA